MVDLIAKLEAQEAQNGTQLLEAARYVNRNWPSYLRVLSQVLGRELSDFDVAGWMPCLGDRARDDVAEAALRAARTCVSLSSATTIR